MDEMSHCTSFLCLNALFEFSFFRAGHLTAGDGTLESAEIVAVLRTAYRVFFENSQMFGAERWNERKFVHSVRQSTGTCGNLFTASDRILERLEIRCQRATRRWNLRKFFPRERRDAGTDRNSLPASDERLEPSEICSQHAMEHWNWWKTSASFTK